MSAYRRDFDGSKHMSFLIKDGELLEKNIMKFVKKSAIASKKDKYLKTKVKTFE